MINKKINKARTAFFDRATVRRAISKGKRTVLSKFGAFVRRRARSSLKPARQKSLSEMSHDELVVYEARKRAAEKEGRRPPQRPMASSKPGQPPRMLLGLGYIKKFLFFAFDADRESVVIGPALLNGGSGAPETLEHGGNARLRGGRSVRIEPRPYMRPAFEKELPGVPKLWQDAIKG